MNQIERSIRSAIQRQADWEAFEIPDDKLTRLAEAVRSELGLQLSLGGQWIAYGVHHDARTEVDQ